MKFDPQGIPSGCWLVALFPTTKAGDRGDPQVPGQVRHRSAKIRHLQSMARVIDGIEPVNGEYTQETQVSVQDIASSVKNFQFPVLAPEGLKRYCMGRWYSVQQQTLEAQGAVEVPR
jgi:hypothetical protein